MAKSHSADIAKLEKQITTLSDALARLGKGTTLRDLINIIHRPGWTTPAEFLFASVIVDNLLTQVKSIEKVQASLVKAAKRVKP